MPVYPVILAGSKITASVLTAMQPLTIVKPGDTSITSSTTLTNDPDLVLPVAAAATYDFRCYLDFEGASSGGGLSWQWAVPSAATLRYVLNANTAVSTLGLTITGGSTVDANTNGATVLQGAYMDGTLVVSSTAGNLQLKWCQVTSSGTATIVHAQSKIWLQRTS